MANIMLNKRGTGQAESQLRRMQSETEAAQKKVMSAIGGLDFEVASKQNIQNKLSKINNGLYKQISLSEQYGRCFANVTNAIVESDEKFGTESQSIADKIRDVVEGVVEKISNFFFRNRMKKIVETGILFMPNPGVLKFHIMVERLKEIAKKMREWMIIPIVVMPPSVIGGVTEILDDIITTHPHPPISPIADVIGNISTADNHPPAPPIDNGVFQDILNNTAPEGMKDYEGSSKDMTPGGYKDFNVVDGFDDSMVHSQFEYNTYYTNSNGQRKNGGCTSVSDSIVYALNNDTEFQNPEKSWGADEMTHWTTSSIKCGSGSAQERLNETYNQIVNNGKAVVFRVTNHSMAAVGIREGADPNNVTPADILVCDSGVSKGGRICTLQEYLDATGRSVHEGTGYALRV